MKTIENREDVTKLVYSFYDKIRVDEMLGPIFDMHLDKDTWPPHLEKLVDFWESNLFGIPKFKGNPARVHAMVDYNLDYGVTEEHFARWVMLWHSTIDTYFYGDLADRAKQASLGMSRGIFGAIMSHRPGGYN